MKNTARKSNTKITAIELLPHQPLTGRMIRNLADPNHPLVSITLRDVVSADDCAAAVRLIDQLQQEKYSGSAASSLATGLGHAAWQPRYTNDNNLPKNTVERWSKYFDSVQEWDSKRTELLKPVFGDDPLVIIQNILSHPIGKPLERAVHPRYGRKMGAGLIRKGQAAAHFDWARSDLGLNAKGHIGVVLVLDADEKAVQRVWNHQAIPDQNGNYDLDAGNSEYVDCPSPKGSLCLLAARYTHAVIDKPDRYTVAAHIAHLAENDRWVIYA